MKKGVQFLQIVKYKSVRSIFVSSGKVEGLLHETLMELYRESAVNTGNARKQKTCKSLILQVLLFLVNRT